MIGEVEVIEVPSEYRVIDEEFVAKNCAEETARVIFKTRNSAFWAADHTDFRTDFTTSSCRRRSCWWNVA